MVATPQDSSQEGSVPPAGTSALDPKQLALASFSSLLGGAVGAAFGGSVVMTFVGMALAPWLTAFVEHPGPHRRRRVALVALLAFLVYGCRKAFAAIRGRRTSATYTEARQLRRVARTGAIAIVIAVFVITAGEIAAGQPLTGDRDTTFFGGNSSSSQGPSAGASVSPGVPGSSVHPRANPSSRVPNLQLPGQIVATTPSLDGRRVTYRVTAADAAGNALMPTCTPPSGAMFEIGDTGVRCTAADADGKRAEGSFVVTVRRGRAPSGKDTKPPTLSVPDDFTRKTESDDGVNVKYLATASDDRDGPLTPTCRPASGKRFQLGRTQVTCSTADATGHTTRADFTVTVARGDTGPAAKTPASASGAANTPSTGSGTGNTPPTTGRTGNTPPTTGRTGNTPPTTGRAVDTTPPDVSVPDNIQQKATGPQGREISYTATATDDRDGTLKPVCDPPSGGVFAIGTRSVRCTATNSAGLTASRSFTVEVIDGPPKLEITPPDRVTAPDDKGADVTFTAGATDDVDGRLQPDCEPRSGSFFEIGETTVTCTVKDSAGHTESRSFTVDVVEQPDTTRPVISGKKKFTAISRRGEPGVVRIRLTGRDDRDGLVRVRCVPRSGSQFPLGVTPVTCSARDRAGNETTYNVEVEVVLAAEIVPAFKEPLPRPAPPPPGPRLR
jgi:hypothetical protein